VCVSAAPAKCLQLCVANRKDVLPDTFGRSSETSECRQGFPHNATRRPHLPLCRTCWCPVAVQAQGTTDDWARIDFVLVGMEVPSQAEVAPLEFLTLLRTRCNI